MNAYIKNKLSGSVGMGNVEKRETWLEKTLAKIPAKSKILDAGAGELQYKKFCDHLEYTSQDLGKYDGQGTEGKHTKKWDTSGLDIVSDIIKIPVPDNSFDAIMCIEVFEHISEPAKAVAEFRRILKPGGRLILTAPVCSLTHFAPYYFATGYSKYWYEHVLKENSFTVDELIHNGNYFEYLAQEIRRLPSVGKEYSESTAGLGLFGKIIRSVMLVFLNQMSKKNKKSEELLCFGMEVLAHKNNS